MADPDDEVHAINARVLLDNASVQGQTHSRALTMFGLSMQCECRSAAVSGLKMPCPLLSASHIPRELLTRQIRMTGMDIRTRIRFHKSPHSAVHSIQIDCHCVAVHHQRADHQMKSAIALCIAARVRCGLAEQFLTKARAFLHATLHAFRVAFASLHASACSLPSSPR